MSRRVLIIMLIVSIGINLGLLGFTAYDAVRESHWSRDRGPLPRWLDKIEGLTPEQIDRLHDIMTEGKPQIEKLRSDLILKRHELNLLICQRNPDPASINAKIAEISGIQTQMEQLIVRQIIAIREILTPEQQKILSDYMSRMMPPPSGGRYGGPMMPGGGMGHRWGPGDPDR